jgi:hypothetical protein
MLVLSAIRTISFQLLPASKIMRTQLKSAMPTVLVHFLVLEPLLRSGLFMALPARKTMSVFALPRSPMCKVSARAASPRSVRMVSPTVVPVASPMQGAGGRVRARDAGPWYGRARLKLSVLANEGTGEFNPDCTPSTGSLVLPSLVRNTKIRVKPVPGIRDHSSPSKSAEATLV